MTINISPAPDRTSDLLDRWLSNYDNEAFDELYRRLYPTAYRVALGCTTSDENAHDVAQAAFLLFYQKRVDIREEPALMAWLWKTIHHLAKRQLREARRKVPIGDFMGLVANPEDELSDVLEALQKLREQDRELIFLRYLQGLSVEEISKLTNAKVSATQMRITRALQTLRRRCGVATMTALLALLGRTQAEAAVPQIPSWTYPRKGAVEMVRQVNLTRIAAWTIHVSTAKWLVGITGAGSVVAVGTVAFNFLRQPALDTEKLSQLEKSLTGRWRGFAIDHDPTGKEFHVPLVVVGRLDQRNQRFEVRHQAERNNVHTTWYQFLRGTDRVLTESGPMKGTVTKDELILEGTIKTDFNSLGQPIGDPHPVRFTYNWASGQLLITQQRLDIRHNPDKAILDKVDDLR